MLGFRLQSTRLFLVFSSQSAVDGFHERVDLGRVVAVEVVGVDGPHEGAGEVHVVGKLTLRDTIVSNCHRGNLLYMQIYVITDQNLVQSDIFLDFNTASYI